MTDPLPIQPLDGPVDAVVSVPGSKSITNRALLLAALSPGSSRIEGALFSDDTRYMAAALGSLGIAVKGNEPLALYEVDGTDGAIPARQADLFIGNAGTAARFLTAYLSLGHGRYRMDGIPRMRQRPINDLIEALVQLGVDLYSEHANGCLPIIVNANGLAGGRATVRADVSSQYLSALLMVAPFAASDVKLAIEGDLSSEPYIDITVRMMEQWGARVQREGNRFIIPSGQRYSARTYQVEPDASSASYFFAAAAVTGGRIRVEGIGADALQGDVGFVDVLAQMGCAVDKGADYIEVRGVPRLHGVDVDMNAISDTVMTLAAIAPFADAPTNIRKVAHIRHKETDRVAALVTELKRLGVCVDEREDGMTIHPATSLQPAEIQTYDDHRMAMSFAIAGLRSPGISICEPGCVSKTFPSFFQRLDKIRSQA